MFVRESLRLAIGPPNKLPSAGALQCVPFKLHCTFASASTVDRGTWAVVCTCRALRPGRPGAVLAGGNDSLVGRNVEANDTTAMRPGGLSK